MKSPDSPVPSLVSRMNVLPSNLKTFMIVDCPRVLVGAFEEIV